MALIAISCYLFSSFVLYEAAVAENNSAGKNCDICPLFSVHERDDKL